MKKYVFFLVFALFCGWQELQSQGYNYFVDINRGNNNNTGLSWGSAYQTLEYAISQSQGDDKIFVSSGVYPVPVPQNCFEIDKNLILIGGGDPATGQQSFGSSHLVGNSINSVIIAKGSYLVLDGFTIEKGGGAYGNNYGGGVFSLCPNVKIVNSCIRNNMANDGGGLYSKYGENIHIENCVFHSNTSTMSGGAIFLDGNKSDNLDVTILSTEIVCNGAGNGDGGGIAGRKVKDMFMSYSHIGGCVARGNGGGIFLEDMPQNSTYGMDHVTIHDNVCCGDGGGLCVENSNGNNLSLKVSNTIFWNNDDNGGLQSTGISLNVAVLQNGNPIQNPNFISYDCCILKNLAATATYYGAPQATCFDSDPYFVNPVHPRNCQSQAPWCSAEIEDASPAINQACNIYPTFPRDIYGNPCPDAYSGLSDIGCYEYQVPAHTDHPVPKVLQRKISNDNIYPNPVESGGEFWVSAPQGSMLSLWNMQGICIWTGVAADNATAIQAPSQSGVYVLKIQPYHQLPSAVKVVVK